MSDSRPRTDDPLLDLGEDDSLSTEQLDNQVQKAQEQLIALKRAQETLEKQKRELEELSRRQEQLSQGKQEMLEKFTRAVVVLERETYEAQKRVEQLQSIHAGFAQHMDALDAINPKSWEGLDMNKELLRSLSIVDDARAEYSKSLPKISLASDSESSDPMAVSAGYQLEYAAQDGPKDFAYWLKAGFAFTLPLLAIGLVLVFVLMAHLSAGK